MKDIKDIDLRLATEALSTLGKYRLKNDGSRQGELPNAIEMMAFSENGKIIAAPVRFKRLSMRDVGQFYLEHYEPFSFVIEGKDEINDVFKATIAIANAPSPQGDHYAQLRAAIKELAFLEKISKIYDLDHFGSKGGVCAFANKNRCLLMEETTFRAIHDDIKECLEEHRITMEKNIVVARKAEAAIRILYGTVAHPLS